MLFLCRLLTPTIRNHGWCYAIWSLCPIKMTVLGVAYNVFFSIYENFTCVSRLKQKVICNKRSQVTSD